MSEILREMLNRVEDIRDAANEITDEITDLIQDIEHTFECVTKENNIGLDEPAAEQKEWIVIYFKELGEEFYNIASIEKNEDGEITDIMPMMFPSSPVSFVVVEYKTLKEAIERIKGITNNDHPDLYSAYEDGATIEYEQILEKIKNNNRIAYKL